MRFGVCVCKSLTIRNCRLISKTARRHKRGQILRGSVQVMNLPFIGQFYRRSGFRFIADDQGNATLTQFDQVRDNGQVEGYIRWVNTPVHVWLMPDGNWSSISLMPSPRFRRLKNLYIPDKNGKVRINGRYPNFTVSDTGRHVFMHVNRTFSTTWNDFVTEADDWYRERRERLAIRKRPENKLPPQRAYEQQGRSWNWKLIDRDTKTVLRIGSCETRRDAEREAAAEIRLLGFELKRRSSG